MKAAKLFGAVPCLAAALLLFTTTNARTDDAPPPPIDVANGLQFQWNKNSWEVGFVLQYSALHQKTLTYSRDGRLNRTWLLVDGARRSAERFGDSGDNFKRSRHWEWPGLRVTQAIEKIRVKALVVDQPLPVKNPLHTALVTYEVENTDSRAHAWSVETAS